MKIRTTGIGFAVALALALPAAAPGAEESVVPPENSAATQYTEALPTAGGDKEAGGGSKKPSPAKVLGARNAKQLESHGQDGREVARVVAETAPETSVASSGAPATKSPQTSSGDTSQGGGKGAPHEPQQSKADRSPHHEAAAPEPRTPTALPSGSSGFGEVIAEATGSSSSGGLGMLLPLAIVGAIAWSLSFLWRQRRPAD